MSISAIRWLNTRINPLVSEGTYSLEESLHFEMNPHREVSVELLDDLGSFNQMREVGLLVDIERTPLQIGYYEDAWTEIMEDGKLRAPSYDESECVVGESIAYCWEDAERMLAANPDRECWAEGVIAHPIYTAVVCFEESDMARTVAAHLGLEIQVIQQSEFVT